MASALATVTIVDEGSRRGFRIINARDFDPAVHVKVEPPTAAAFAPTLEQFVAAGYAPGLYPPAGCPEVDSEGLRAYRAGQAASSAPSAPAAGSIDAYEALSPDAGQAAADEAHGAPAEVVTDRQAIAAAMEDTVEPTVSAIDEALARKKAAKR